MGENVLAEYWSREELTGLSAATDPSSYELGTVGVSLALDNLEYGLGVALDKAGHFESASAPAEGHVSFAQVIATIDAGLEAVGSPAQAPTADVAGLRLARDASGHIIGAAGTGKGETS